MIGDHLIIATYCEYTEAELVDHRPRIVLVDENNSPMPTR
jgi:aspartate 1-decarboxylase